MPLSIACLSAAFKIASKWTQRFETQSSKMFSANAPKAWYQTLLIIAAAVFVFMCLLYFARLLLFRNKCWKEWDCPMRSPSFGAISLCMTLFAFLIYDIDDSNANSEESPYPVLSRVFLWIGAVTQTILTILKFGEWVGKRLELEHIHPTWMMLPVGMMFSALCAPIIPMFQVSEGNENNHIEANILCARFFYSFAYLMWITLFIISFFKVTTTHNSDERLRHSIFIWLAAPCVVGLADFSICASFNRMESMESTIEQINMARCKANFSQYFFVSLMIFFGLSWGAMPYINFFGRDKFNMGYWMECFSINALAACSAFFYSITGFYTTKIICYIGLSIASVANVVAFLHTIVLLVRKRGIFTPEVKWGPLSFMKLTHEAFRGQLPKLRSLLSSIDLRTVEGQQNLKLFAAEYAEFCILHEEHAKHEDEVIFKVSQIIEVYFHVFCESLFLRQLCLLK